MLEFVGIAGTGEDAYPPGAFDFEVQLRDMGVALVSVAFAVTGRTAYLPVAWDFGV